MPRSLKLSACQPDVYHLTIQHGYGPLLGKQGHGVRPSPLLKHLDGFAPRRLLAVGDLAQVQHLTLRDSPTRYPPGLHQALVAVLFTVFETLFGP